jgi:hypothetical protein
VFDSLVGWPCPPSDILTFTFRAFSRLFYPKALKISPFVRRKRNNNISLSLQ